MLDKAFVGFYPSVMEMDPRFLNKVFNTETVHTYMADYATALHECLRKISAASIEAASQLLADVHLRGARIFVAGNGGSAAISEHLSCDWQKGVYVSNGFPGPKVQCLTSNVSLFTAISNDFGYAKSFSFQLELAGLNAKDVVLLISSSGNSENILHAAVYAKEKGAKVVGFSGFDGGKLKALADVSIHVPFHNYGLVEDAHQVIMHVLAQYHDRSYRKKTDQSNE